MKKPRIKVCCISSLHEARQAIECGASAVGLVGAMPSGPGVISDELIREIAAAIPPPIASFLLSSEVTAFGIEQHYLRTFPNTIQLVDHLPSKGYALLRKALPSIRLVQVIHVLDKKSIEEALEASELADALLLDSGNPRLAVKELGGTGRTHNWHLSRSIVEQSRKPVFLAGGLNPGNVAEAIERVQPFGIDVCSGVRTDGNLDPVKLEAFFKAAGY